MTVLQPTRAMSGRTWTAIALGFVGAFLVSMALTGASTGLKEIAVGLGIILLVVAAILAITGVRNIRAEVAERTDWARFAAALDDGVRFEVPDEMGYAPTLPALLDDLADVGEPADGEARHAIVGEEADVHWCAFQHERPGGTATVGMIGLHPERVADAYPRVEVHVADAEASQFDQRYSVDAADPAFADVVLTDDARAQLMAAEPFGWRLDGNQIVTSVDAPCTPEEAIWFIEDRVKPLARIAAAIPLDA